MKIDSKQLWNDFIHLFLPHLCLGCDSDTVERDKLLCLSCFQQLPETGYSFTRQNPVFEKFQGRIELQQATSLYFFTKASLIQHLLFELKYHGNEKAGYYLGQILGITLSASALYDSIDVIVPIPLNEKKMRIRGYNQAALISRGIAEVWRKPVEEDAVSRNIFTESQTQKDRIQRLENMEGAFTVHSPKKLAGKHILLVDDIVTTGATLEACGLSILEIEETKLSVATVACTF